METHILCTKRLVLKPVTNKDYRFIFEIRTNPEVTKHIRRTLFLAEKDSAAFIENLKQQNFEKPIQFWVIEMKGTVEPIGTICLWNLDLELNVGEIGYELLPAFWGKGYMAEAAEKVVEYGFNNLKLESIEAHTDKRNVGSIRLLNRLNFVLEPEFEDAILPDNELYVRFFG